METPKHIYRLTYGDFQWLNITKNTARELHWLKQNFDFHYLDLKDCLPPNQRPKLVEHPTYLFMVLLFPVYNRKTKEIKTAEIDFFISNNYLITIHDGQSPVLRELFTECQKNRSLSFLQEHDPSGLIYEALNRLFKACFPMLLHINNDIENIEAHIFEENSPRLIYDVVLIKKNIVTFRKTMQAHKGVIRRLVDVSGRFFPNIKLDLYFKDLIEQTKEIWDFLENQRDTISALYESQSSIASYRLNSIIKVLTIISVIFMPINLLAFLFGMDTPHPLMDTAYGFWIVVGFMTIIGLLMIIGFKKKGWW
ncbi:magnesium transporter CorA family protein [Candidatus Falkowbacteria bacterium]|nr:magnesium transporter CorA family protein [Candidatus Falkowbacteria bacterium]